MPSAVKPEEVADLIRRCAEMEHDLRALGRRVSIPEGPLAIIAAEMCHGCAEGFSETAARLREAAPAITAVTAE